MIHFYSKYSMPWKVVLTPKDDPNKHYSYYQSDTEMLSFDDERYNFEIFNQKTPGTGTVQKFNLFSKIV